MTIKSLPLSLVSLIAALCTFGSANAEIYKWTDQHGKVHFSATPPKDTSTKAIDIEKDIKFKIGKVQTSQPSPTKSVKKVANAAKGNKKEVAKKDTKTANDPYAGDKTPSRLAYCNQLRSNIHTLENSKNIKLVRKGETQPLTEAQRVSRLTTDKADMEKNCKGL